MRALFARVRSLLHWAVTLPVFFPIDLVWLGVVAKSFYRQRLGHLLADQVSWPAAILFYLAYIAGIVFFAVRPALEIDPPLVVHWTAGTPLEPSDQVPDTEN